MKLTFDQQIDLAEELSEKYERFEAERRIVRARLVKTLDQQIHTEMADQFEALAKSLHEAHTAGLPKASIRKAIKKAGNPTGFDEIWFASPIENVTDLRNTSSTLKRDFKKWLWIEDDLLVTLDDGTKHTLQNVVLEDEEFVVFANNEEYYGTPEYTELVLAAKDALKERSNA